ncbi:DeoR/GlpR family DNA-binding transcription regulator [Vagococcus entomophilus]|uniref:DeoR family transcriptional regulator n=1 Tax=Vagococcus entomophilus TaxID=1160095 RepID=A0A430AKT5_9ENTE|nr:DeoR/GlpR family DNA-binding transcription regulator [Vagococcus entomophilus]RSU08507.1 DeoR family transcriptional regulator [Vagococcus entomophilus]
MKASYEEIKKRQNALLKVLDQTKQATVSNLAQELSVSEVTVRRDLHLLEKMALIERFHGGARIIDAIQTNDALEKIEQIKKALAQKAASFIQNGQTVFLNTSSTALLCVSELQEKRVNIITNNVKASTVEHHPNTTIILSGGEIRFPKEALVGDIAIDSFSKMKADIAIIGCNGVSPEEGITTPVLHEAKINSLILERTTGLKIVVADYRKIGTTTNFLSGSLKMINYLITDSFADPKMIKQIEKQGVIVIQIPI